MAIQNETTEPFVSHKLDEAETERMKSYLQILGDRIEVLEWLDNYAYFFPDWQKAINEALFMFMDSKQALKISCEEEKDMITQINFFFSKMAFFSGLITDWHKELKAGMEINKEMIGE